MLRVRVNLIVVMALALLPTSAWADVLTSPHYRLDPDVANTFGGAISSGHYKLVDSGGEAVVGLGSSPSYKLTQGYVSQLTQSIQLSILPNGIAAYYPLDTNTGIQAYDVSTNENRGALTNSPTWVAGKIGQGLGFNGTTQYVNVPNSSSLNLTGNITIEAWVNLTDTVGTNMIATKTTGDGSTNNTFELRTEASTGKLQFRAFDSALRTVTSVGAVATGSFVHVAVTKTGGTATLYINGINSGSGAVGTATSNTNAMKLGSRDDLANFFKGSLDEVKIYNRALNAAEVANDYSAGNSGLRSAFTLPNVTPGTSQTYNLDAIVRTDAGGYDLYLMQDHDLRHTDASTTIPAISANITLPAAWSEGVTKGLGFGVTSGTQIEAKWGTTPNFNYAAIPGSSTNFHSRTGFGGGAAEKTTVQYRADVVTGQKQGTYSNTVIYTATLKP